MKKTSLIIMMSLCLVLALIAVRPALRYDSAWDHEQAISTLSSYGSLVLYEERNVLQYRTCWEITREEINALYLLSKKYDVILYTY